MVLSKIKICFSTSNFILLSFFLAIFKKISYKLCLFSVLKGPFLLAIKRRKFVVVRSIHIYKRSGIHFAIKVYKACMDILRISNYKYIFYFIYYISTFSPLGVNIKLMYRFSC